MEVGSVVLCPPVRVTVTLSWQGEYSHFFFPDRRPDRRSVRRTKFYRRETLSLGELVVLYRNYSTEIERRIAVNHQARRNSYIRALMEKRELIEGMMLKHFSL